jgi:transposase InsO family protein
VKLPPSADPVTKESYDGIIVVTDRFTKFGRFIPYRETWTATDLAHVFIKHVVANHGMPEQLVSDRDKLFISNFWTALMQHLGVKHKMSTSYHPQTDGQTERLNQTLEQYLRCYVNDRQDNWISLLLLAQIVYNHAPTTTTGTSPFYATYGFQPNNLNGTMEVLAKNPAIVVTAFDL